MKCIDAEKLIESLEKIKQAEYENCGETGIFQEVQKLLDSLQQEQPMPDSTKLIELWHADKEMLKEKDFRNDPWRLAYNAFMCGFGRGLAVNKQEQPETKEQSSHLEHWLAFFGCPEENIDNCITQIAQGYGACRYLEGIQHGTEAVNELAKQEQPEVDLDKEIERFVSVKGLRTRVYLVKGVAHHFYELGLNARKEE